jgi:hypothetical protein
MSLVRAPKGLLSSLVNLGCMCALVGYFQVALAASATYATVGYDRGVTLESPKNEQSLFSMDAGDQQSQAGSNEAVADKEHQDAWAE